MSQRREPMGRGARLLAPFIFGVLFLVAWDKSRDHGAGHAEISPPLAS